MTNSEAERPSAEAGAQARHWIARLASGDISEAEMADFREWRNLAGNDQAFRRERALWRNLSAIEDAFAPPVPPRSGRGRTSRWISARKKRLAIGAVAASLVAIAAGPQLVLMARADHRTGIGEVRNLVLADGSQAVLDTNSAIAVDFGHGRRDITLLAGRAWFKVRHGDPRPFRVAALGGVTQDVGTAFAVERGEAGVDVGVTEGAVQLLSPVSGKALVLTAGQHARYRQGEAAQRTGGPSAETIAAWRTGELLIRNMPVEAAIRAIGRYRKAPIFTWGRLDMLEPVSGTFTTGQPDDALSTLAQMRGLSVTRLPGGILILRAGTTG